MLTKELLRVSRAGGGYRPEFSGPDDEPLAACLLDTYRDHVGHTRGELDEAVEAIEREGQFKLVRGLAKLLDRESTVETRAPLPPERARRAAFEASEAVGVASAGERQRALARAADRLGAEPDAVAASLYADLVERQIVTAFDSRWGPAELLEQYDLSLAGTALFDATEVRVRSTEPKALVSAVKRLRLMYEIRRGGEGPTDREVVVTGPAAPFSGTRRYGTRFARLLRTVAKAPEWRLEATIDDRGRERTMTLSTGDVTVPGTEPVAEPSYDSGVEREFAARFEALELDWSLTREPEPLAAGAHVVIPDFAFEWAHSEFRVFFEIMGFWTPEYVEKKLSRLAALEDVELLVAVDESLGVESDIEALDHRAIPYRDSVRVKDVRGALRRYEERLIDESAAALPDELVPDDDAVTIEALAAEHGVPQAAIEERAFPEHRRIGRTLVRPALLDSLGERLEAGMALTAAEAELEAAGIDDASAALSALGYRVEWEGLSGGTLRGKG